MRSCFFNRYTWGVPQRMQRECRDKKNDTLASRIGCNRFTRFPHSVHRETFAYSSFWTAVRCVRVRCFPQFGHPAMSRNRAGQGEHCFGADAHVAGHSTLFIDDDG